MSSDCAIIPILMPKQLIFVRHGHTANNSTDHKLNRLMGWDDDHFQLNKQGRLDAQETASKLKHCHIDAVYHSDLVRTTETADIITRKLGIVATPSFSIRDRNLGNFANLTMHEIKVNRPHDWDKFLDHHDSDWNGLEGESLRDIHKRFDQFMQQLKAKHHDQSVLLITHSGFIHTVLRDYFNFFPKESFMEVGHSSVTILEKSGDDYKLVVHNR